MLSIKLSERNKDWEKTVDTLSQFLNIGKLEPVASDANNVFIWVSPEEKKQGAFGKMIKRAAVKKRYELDANDKLIKVYQDAKEPQVKINIQSINYIGIETLHPSVHQKALKKNPGKYIVLETIKGKLYGFPVLENEQRKLIDDLKRVYALSYDKSKAGKKDEDYMEVEERKKYIRKHIDRIADDIFVDDTECLWTVLGLKHVGNMTYVQMSTTSTEVSFNQVRILLQGHVDNTMDFLACYVFEDGTWKHFCGTDPLVEEDEEYDSAPAGQSAGASAKAKSPVKTRKAVIVRDKR